MDRPLIKFYSAADIKVVLKMVQAIDAMRDTIQDLAAAQRILELSKNKDLGTDLIF